ILLETRSSAFVNPFADPPPTLLAADEGSLARGLLVWQGGGSAFDKRLAPDILPKAEGVPPFAQLWGRAWERRQIWDVPLTRKLDLEKMDLEALVLPASVVKPLPGEE